MSFGSWHRYYEDYFINRVPLLDLNYLISLPYCLAVFQNCQLCQREISHKTLKYHITTPHSEQDKCLSDFGIDIMKIIS